MIFCQQRALYHGANTNPNYNEYRTGINSIILGQTTTSTKSNAGKHSAKPFALSLPLTPSKETKIELTFMTLLAILGELLSVDLEFFINVSLQTKCY